MATPDIQVARHNDNNDESARPQPQNDDESVWPPQLSAGLSARSTTFAALAPDPPPRPPPPPPLPRLHFSPRPPPPPPLPRLHFPYPPPSPMVTISCDGRLAVSFPPVESVLTALGGGVDDWHLLPESFRDRRRRCDADSFHWYEGTYTLDSAGRLSGTSTSASRPLFVVDGRSPLAATNLWWRPRGDWSDSGLNHPQDVAGWVITDEAPLLAKAATPLAPDRLLPPSEQPLGARVAVYHLPAVGPGRIPMSEVGALWWASCGEHVWGLVQCAPFLYPPPSPRVHFPFAQRTSEETSRVGFGLVADRDSTSSLQAAAATSAATSAAAPVLTPLSHSLIAPRLAPAPASLGSEQHIQDAGSRGPSFAMLLLVLAAAVLLYLFSMMMTAVACRARPQVRQSARGTCDKKVCERGANPRPHPLT